VLHDRMPAGYDRAISPTAIASTAPGSAPPAGAPCDSIEAACPNPADLIRHFVCVSPRLGTAPDQAPARVLACGGGLKPGRPMMAGMYRSLVAVSSRKAFTSPRQETVAPFARGVQSWGRPGERGGLAEGLPRFFTITPFELSLAADASRTWFGAFAV